MSPNDCEWKAERSCCHWLGVRFSCQKKVIKACCLLTGFLSPKPHPQWTFLLLEALQTRKGFFFLMWFGAEDNFQAVCKKSRMKVFSYGRKWVLRWKSEILVWQGDNLLPWMEAQSTNSFWVAGDPYSDEGYEYNHPPPRGKDPSFWNQAGVLISSAKWLWRDPFV